MHNISPFFNRTFYAALQNAHRIYIGLLRYGIGRPLRSVPGRVTIGNCLNWSDASAYIAGQLQVRKISRNIDLAQMRGLRAVLYHNTLYKHGLKSTEASVALANQMSRHGWGTDEYGVEALREYARSMISQ